MHEALEAVIKFGFESMNLKTIEAFTLADNERVSTPFLGLVINWIQI